MTTQLESLQRHSVIVADTGDLDAIQRFKATDATTNPSLILKAAQDPRFTRIVDEAVRTRNPGRGSDKRSAGSSEIDAIADGLLVNRCRDPEADTGTRLDRDRCQAQLR